MGGADGVDPVLGSRSTDSREVLASVTTSWASRVPPRHGHHGTNMGADVPRGPTRAFRSCRRRPRPTLSPVCASLRLSAVPEGPRSVAHCGFEGAWHRATLERGSTSHPERRTVDMSTCDICHADDVVAQRSSRGTDAQQRVVVHQQCPRGHRWHLAFEIADNPLGDRDILICDCPVEGVSI